jgi:hypothetical protein
MRQNYKSIDTGDDALRTKDALAEGNSDAGSNQRRMKIPT